MANADWSKADERLLQELQARKQEFEKASIEPLTRYIRDNMPASLLSSQRHARLVRWLIADADTIRDLLQPFDSGVRPDKSQGQPAEKFKGLINSPQP